MSAITTMCGEPQCSAVNEEDKHPCVQPSVPANVVSSVVLADVSPPYGHPPNVPEQPLHVSTFIHGRKLQNRHQGTQLFRLKISRKYSHILCLVYSGLSVIYLT